MGALLLATACSQPPWNPESLVDELRVGAVVASPPEVGPGDVVELDVYVLDPDDGPIDVVTWFCTQLDGQCAEALGGSRPLDAFAAGWKDADRVERATFEVPIEVAALLPPDSTAQPISSWTLACRAGLCPLVDQVLAGPAPGTPDYDAVVAQLVAPGTVLRSLPMVGVSLGVKSMLLSNRPEIERNRNPGLQRLGDDALVVETGGSLFLYFDVGSGAVSGLATAGAFADPTFGVQGETVLQWYAPDLPGRVDLMVVVEDGIGGTSVWRDIAEVVAP